MIKELTIFQFKNSFSFSENITKVGKSSGVESKGLNLTVLSLEC